MKIGLSILYIAGFLAAFSSLANAQNISDNIEMGREIIQTKRKAIVMQNLGLSPAESEKFWVVYNSYRDDMKDTGDQYIEVIKRYAKERNAGTLNDNNSRKLLRDWLAVEKRWVDVKEKYVPRFSKVIPSTKVLRFYQIDNKLDAEIKGQLAREIPLVPLEK